MAAQELKAHVAVWQQPGNDRLKAALASAALSALRTAHDEDEQGPHARPVEPSGAARAEAALGVAETVMAHAIAGVCGPTTDERVLEELVTAVQLSVDSATQCCEALAPRWVADTPARRCCHSPPAVVAHAAKHTPVFLSR